MSGEIRLGLILTLSACAAALAAKPPAAPPPPGFGETVEVNVVNVDVYATDKDGNRIAGLKKEDFTVFEDGKPVEITHFADVAGRTAPAPRANAAAGIPTPQPPAAATAAEAPAPENPLNLIVFIDNFHIHPAHRSRVLEQVRRFISQNVGRDDRVMVATSDPSLHIRQPFTNDPALLDAALKEIEKLPAHGMEAENTRRTALRALFALQEEDVREGEPCAHNLLSPVEGYAQGVRDEVRRAIASLTLLVNSLAGIPGRKALVHVSDGLPLTPGEELFQVLFEICGGGAATSGIRQDNVPGGLWDASALGPSAYQAQQAATDALKYNTVKDWDKLVAHANANRVSLYPLQASGLQGNFATEAGFDPGEQVLQLLSVQTVQTTNLQNPLTAMASGTGGRAILNANDVLPDLARVQQDFASYYSLGYTPAHQGDGREHRIEVKVKRSGVRLRYRQSYRDKPAVEKTVDRTLAALLYGFEENPLGITVEVGEQTPSPTGSVAVPIRLKIPLFKLAILNREEAGTFEGNLRLFVATRTSEGNSSPMRQVAVPIRIPRQQVLNAMGQFYLYTLTLELQPGRQQVAVAVRDELAATTSYLSRAVTVGTVAAAGPSRP